MICKHCGAEKEMYHKDGCKLKGFVKPFQCKDDTSTNVFVTQIQEESQSDPTHQARQANE